MVRNARITSQLAIIAALYAGLGTFLLSTDPRKLPVVLVVVPFLLLFVALFYTIWLLLHKIGRRRSAVIAVCLATLPVLMIVLQSINQLTIRDVVILLVLEAGLLFYITRTSFLRLR